jgi:hypothetical protein
VTPDFTIPANFFSDQRGHAALAHLSQRHATSFDIGELPLDGLYSLNRGSGSLVNSPKNFAGQQGSINLARCRACRSAGSRRSRPWSARGTRGAPAARAAHLIVSAPSSRAVAARRPGS